MQTRTVGSIIATALVVVGLAGCRNMPRGGGLGRGPDVRTIAGVGLGPERLAVRDGQPSTISSRVNPPVEDDRPGAVVGQVIDDQGVPVSNARVRLAIDGAPGGREVVGTTNRAGQFLLKGLRPGDEYTLIAEWDDGEEFLLGRSSVSSPSEEVRIRVASVDGADRPRIASGSDLKSSRAASFSTDDREFEPASASDDRDGSTRLTPDRSERLPERDRSGWIPADGVRRASIEPSDRVHWPEAQGQDQERSERRSQQRPEARIPDTVDDLDPPPDSDRGRPAARDLDFEDFPLPESTLDGGERRASRTLSPEPVDGGARQAPQRLSPPPEVLETAPPVASPRPGSSAGPVPVVRRFEPEMERDRDAPDPPLLMSDAVPEVDGDEADPSEGPASDDHPGSMQVRPTPDFPSPSIDPGPEPSSDRLDGPSGDPGPALDPPPRPERNELRDPEPSVSEPAAASSGRARSEEPSGVASNPGDPFSDVPSAPLDPVDEEPEPVVVERPEPAEEAAPEFLADGSRAIVWSDLPPPLPLDRRPDDDPAPSESPDRAGPGKRGFGLIRRVMRDRGEADQKAAIRPAARFDFDRNRLEDFVLPDLNGEAYRLRSEESDYVLLCFWGTWCEPCVDALPHLSGLQGQFGRDRLRVVSIASQRDGEGGPRALSRINRRLGLNFPILLSPTDGPCPVAEAMEVQYYPTLVLLDREGRVVHRETGATGEKLMRLDRAIAAAMDESVMTVTKR